MAARNGRPEKHIQEKYKKRTEANIRKGALVVLAICIAINGISYIVLLWLRPDFNGSDELNLPIKDFVFWGLFAVLAPDILKLLRGEKP